MIRKIPVKQYAGLLGRYLETQRKEMLWLTILLFAGIGLQLLSPLIIRYFIDTANVHETIQPLINAALLFIGVTFVQQVLNVIAAYLGENIGWEATNQLRGDTAQHCLKLDMAFHKSNTSGTMIERVDGDINSLSNFFSNFIILLAGNVLLVVGILVLLFREGWLIGTGMTLFVVFAIWAIQYIRKFAVPHWGRLRQISASFYGFLGEHLEGTEDTRANGATGYVMHRFHGLIREWLPLRVRAFMGWAAMWNTTVIVFALGNATALAICAYLWNKGGITIGTVYMIFYYTELMAKPIEKIRTQMEDLQKADASIVRIRELLETEPAIKDGPGTPVPKGPLSVEFDRVRFSYEGDRMTLDGIHFRLEPGKVLGLLGRTGSGKTTIARMLLRFYDSVSGAVRLGGVDVREAKVAELRERVGMVTQSIEIFEGTVRHNLTFFDDSVPDERIVEVLEELGMGEWLRSLPSGLDSRLESGGGGLSAGEAQLLAFARVFLSDPGLVILDEASSRLDPATEQKIERAVDQLLQNRTCIIIAHRLATIQRADSIMVLDSGVIAEFGDRKQLEKDPNSRYSKLLELGMEEMLT